MGPYYRGSSDSVGLYGSSSSFGGTYFEWFIFKESDIAPYAPTGGSWSFTTNTGTPPTGWSSTPPTSPTNPVYVSIALVNSKNTNSLTWSVPGQFAQSGGGGGGSPATPCAAGIVYGQTIVGGVCSGGQVSLGSFAGKNSQNHCAVAIGRCAGYTSQGINSIAVGAYAGAALQGSCSIAIGQSAGANYQSSGSIAIGQSAGSTYQGSNAIAIGNMAATFAQPRNSIVIAGCGTGFNATGVCQTHVGPVRNATTCHPLYYNPTTREITYG